MRPVSYWLFLLGFLLVLGPPGRAQPAAATGSPPDTLYLGKQSGWPPGYTFRFRAVHLNSRARPEFQERPDRQLRFRSGIPNDALNLGLLNRPARVWVRLPVASTLAERTRFVCSVEQFADSAVLFVQRAGQPGLVRVAGASSWVPAAQRPYPARVLALPFTLDAGERALLYLRIDVRMGAVRLPWRISTEDWLRQREATYLVDSRWLWLLGFYLASAGFVLLLFAFLRDPIFLLYSLYVGLASLFLMMNDGLDAYFLPPALYRALWQVGAYNVMLLAEVCALGILLLFVRLRATQPELYRIGVVLCATAVVFVGAFAALLELRPDWQVGIYIIRELLLGTVLLYGGVGLGAATENPRQRKLAAYFLPTYVLFFIGFTVAWLNHAGLTNRHYLQPNDLAWALCAEMLVLSVLLAARFRHTLRRHALGRVRQARQREALGVRLITAQDEERERLARELHDALGPTLTALHLAWQGRAVREALATSEQASQAAAQADRLLRQVRDEARAISHALLPAELSAGGLAASLAALAHDLDQPDGPVRVSTDLGTDLDELPTAVQLAAYRIAAELLHNAVRHAQARRIVVQVLRYPACLEVVVEDDGRGLNPSASTEGIGLRGVRARVAYLGGQVHVDSSERGTIIIAELPLLPA
ncbi:hypothetical protein GCM10023185_29570 [Hymenobacter saemangeumensis]|uniref:histidine kinase n=1 Tax=Hymenobacter saemangeumensis TaxID=1084522 RepID=A0ABP8IL57_9BACT